MCRHSPPNSVAGSRCLGAVGTPSGLRTCLAAVIVAVVVLSGCQWAGSVDQMRKDFVALRYIKAASQADSEPVDAEAAVHNATRAVKLAPDNATVLDRAGRIYVYTGQYQQALATLEKARDHTGRQYLYEIGSCLLHTGQQEKGIEYLTRHLANVRFDYYADIISGRGYALHLNNVGYAYAEADLQLPHALGLTRQAVSFDPLNPIIVDSLGWVYYKLNDLENASFYLERAVRQSLHQPNAELNYHLAMVYIGLGQRTEAARELERALQIRPGYPAAQRELRRLHWELAPPWYAQTMAHAL